MRESQVDAAGVDVDDLPEEAQRHGRALGVPAGEPGAPGRAPGQLAAARRALPESPVSVESLVRVHVSVESVPWPEAVQPVAGDRAIVGEAARVEVHGAGID